MPGVEGPSSRLDDAANMAVYDAPLQLDAAPAKRGCCGRRDHTAAGRRHHASPRQPPGVWAAFLAFLSAIWAALTGSRPVPDPAYEAEASAVSAGDSDGLETLRTGDTAWYFRTPLQRSIDLLRSILERSLEEEEAEEDRRTGRTGGAGSGAGEGGSDVASPATGRRGSNEGRDRHSRGKRGSAAARPSPYSSRINAVDRAVLQRALTLLSGSEGNVTELDLQLAMSRHSVAVAAGLAAETAAGLTSLLDGQQLGYTVVNADGLMMTPHREGIEGANGLSIHTTGGMGNGMGGAAGAGGFIVPGPGGGAGGAGLLVPSPLSPGMAMGEAVELLDDTTKQWVASELTTVRKRYKDPAAKEGGAGPSLTASTRGLAVAGTGGASEQQHYRTSGDNRIGGDGSKGRSAAGASSASGRHLSPAEGRAHTSSEAAARTRASAAVAGGGRTGGSSSGTAAPGEPTVRAPNSLARTMPSIDSFVVKNGHLVTLPRSQRPAEAGAASGLAGFAESEHAEEDEEEEDEDEGEDGGQEVVVGPESSRTSQGRTSTGAGRVSTGAGGGSGGGGGAGTGGRLQSQAHNASVYSIAATPTDATPPDSATPPITQGTLATHGTLHTLAANASFTTHATHATAVTSTTHGTAFTGHTGHGSTRRRSGRHAPMGAVRQGSTGRTATSSPGTAGGEGGGEYNAEEEAERELEEAEEDARPIGQLSSQAFLAASVTSANAVAGALGGTRGRSTGGSRAKGGASSSSKHRQSRSPGEQAAGAGASPGDSAAAGSSGRRRHSSRSGSREKGGGHGTASTRTGTGTGTGEGEDGNNEAVSTRGAFTHDEQGAPHSHDGRDSPGHEGEAQDRVVTAVSNRSVGVSPVRSRAGSSGPSTVAGHHSAVSVSPVPIAAAAGAIAGTTAGDARRLSASTGQGQGGKGGKGMFGSAPQLVTIPSAPSGAPIEVGATPAVTGGAGGPASGTSLVGTSTSAGTASGTASAGLTSSGIMGNITSGLSSLANKVFRRSSVSPAPGDAGAAAAATATHAAGAGTAAAAASPAKTH